LVSDETIYRKKLVERASGWRRFIQLWEDLDEAGKRRNNRPLSDRSPTQRDEYESRL
jgi:hypothetical protein